MMEHYVTLFDSLFLPQGIALHLSLERHAKPYTLWILCVDDEAAQILQQLNLTNTRLLRLPDVESLELKQIRESRSRVEYCWTLTPFTPRFVFNADPTASRVTYVDADLWFRKSPAPIFREYNDSGKNVLITDHAYAAEYDYSFTSGQYCVQFITFSRTAGEKVRKWWEERCLEWCYARYEDRKFGDQLYLDEWPARFASDVHILGDKELILAPWNATRFPYGRSVCWHFHGLRIIARGRKERFAVDCGDYPIPPTAMTYVYREYLKDLQSALAMIRSADGKIRPQKKQSLPRRTKDSIGGYKNQLWRYFIHKRLPL
jgi:hypothetical protein